MTEDQTPSPPRPDTTEKTDARARARALARARQQLNAVTENFQHSLSKVKDPATRRELTVSYVDLLQNYLGKAQLTLTRYHGKLQLRSDTKHSGPAGEPTSAGESSAQAAGPT